MTGEVPTSGDGQPAAEPTPAQTPVTPNRAEAILREAIGAADGRPVPDGTHTVDALVDTLSTRQWLSTKEDGDLRRYLRQVLPGLASQPTRRAGRRRRERRAAHVRPAAVDELLEIAADPDRRVPDEVTDCLVEVLTSPAAVATDPEHLRQAITLLASAGASGSPPPRAGSGVDSTSQPDREQASPGHREPPPTEAQPPPAAAPNSAVPSADIAGQTVEEVGTQILRVAYHAADRLLEAREIGSSAPDWALSVLVDAVCDSVWLADTDAAQPLARMFDQFGFDTPRRVTLPATAPAWLEARVVASARDAALTLLNTVPKRIDDSTPRDHATLAHRLLDTLSQISREVVGGPGALARETALADLRTVVGIVFLPAAGPAADEAERRAAFAVRVMLEERNAWLERQLRTVAEALVTAADAAAAAFRYAPTGSNLAPYVQQWFLTRFPAGLVGIDVSHVVSALKAHLPDASASPDDTENRPPEPTPVDG